MQFCQPGYAYTGPPSTTPYNLNGYPEILGEGNLASVISPNGSMQLVFVPTSQWSRPPYQTPQITNNANWNPTEAWIIRSVLNPAQPTFYQQPRTDFLPVQNNPPYQFSPVPRLPPSGPFELKFHNDISTSTSDILYFYPNLNGTYETMCLANVRNSPSFRFVPPPPTGDYVNGAPIPRSYNSEPMDTVKSVSPTSSSFDMSDDTDCDCHKKNKKKRKHVNKCECKAKFNMRKPNAITCDCKAEMLMRSTCEYCGEMNKRKTNGITCDCKREMNKRKTNDITCDCKEELNKRKTNDITCDCKGAMNKRKTNDITCERKAEMNTCECCGEMNKGKSNETLSKIKNMNNTSCACKEEADKGVATITDQASDCVGAKGRKTQTSHDNASNTSKIILLKKATNCGSYGSCCYNCCTD